MQIGLIAQQGDSSDRRLMSFAQNIIIFRRPGDLRRWADSRQPSRNPSL